MDFEYTKPKPEWRYYNTELVVVREELAQLIGSLTCEHCIAATKNRVAALVQEIEFRGVR